MLLPASPCAQRTVPLGCLRPRCFTTPLSHFVVFVRTKNCFHRRRDDAARARLRRTLHLPRVRVEGKGTPGIGGEGGARARPEPPVPAGIAPPVSPSPTATVAAAAGVASGAAAGVASDAAATVFVSSAAGVFKPVSPTPSAAASAGLAASTTSDAAPRLIGSSPDGFSADGSSLTGEVTAGAGSEARRVGHLQ